MNKARRGELEKLNVELLKLAEQLESIKDAEEESDTESEYLEGLQQAWDSLDGAMSDIDGVITG